MGPRGCCWRQQPERWLAVGRAATSTICGECWQHAKHCTNHVLTESRSSRLVRVCKPSAHALTPLTSSD